MNVWQKCHGHKYIKPLNQVAYRAVEAQYNSSTRKLVDTVEEHEILENLIDSAKPKLLPHESEYHYLLFTPFRYPPLRHGSRFGNTFERALWYGSIHPHTALTEIAYYRLRFMQDTQADLGYLEIFFSVYSVDVATNNGVDLTLLPFSRYKKAISDKQSYRVSQTLGTEMRNQGIETFLYFSARTKKQEKNIGVFTPLAFPKKLPHSQLQLWEAIINDSSIEFTHQDINRITKLLFKASDFNIT